MKLRLDKLFYGHILLGTLKFDLDLCGKETECYMQQINSWWTFVVSYFKCMMNGPDWLFMTKFDV